MLVSVVVPAAAAVVVVVVIAAMAVMMVVVATMITDAMLLIMLIVLCWSSIEPSFIYYCLSMPSIRRSLAFSTISAGLLQPLLSQFSKS